MFSLVRFLGNTYLKKSVLETWGKDGFQKYFGGNNSSVKSKWKYSVRAGLEPALVEDHKFSFHDPVSDNRNENSYSSSSAVIFWL